MSPRSAANVRRDAPKIVYGGVKRDAAELELTMKDMSQFPKSENRLLANMARAAAYSIDTPMSAVGDTVTLPVTVPAAIDRAIADYYFPADNAGKADDFDDASPATIDTSE